LGLPKGGVNSATESFFLLRYLESRNLQPILKWLQGPVEKQWQTVKRFVHAWQQWERSDARSDFGTPISVQYAADHRLRLTLIDERGREVSTCIKPEQILGTVLTLLHHVTVPLESSDDPGQ